MSTSYNDVFDSCELEVVLPKDGVVITDKHITLMEDEEFQLTYKVYPVGSTNVVIWVSDNTSIATVDQNGKVKGIASGTTRIKANLNGEIYAECLVTVISIADKLKASIEMTGGSFVNGYVIGTIGTRLYNSSTETVRVKKLAVLYSTGVEMSSISIPDESSLLKPNLGLGYTMTFNLPTYYPRFEWTFEYNGKEYKSSIGFIN